MLYALCYFLIDIFPWIKQTETVEDLRIGTVDVYPVKEDQKCFHVPC